MRPITATFACIALIAFNTAVAAQTYFVNASSGNDSNAGTDKASAFKTIQRAVDVASSGDCVVVADGKYGAVRSSWDKYITITSESGAEGTVIDGGGSACCIWLGYGSEAGQKSELIGFTLQNGKADYGGGVRGGVLRNCIIKNCKATSGGGGAYNSELNDCTVSGNTAPAGGGIYEGRAVACVFVGNAATEYSGGGANEAICLRCTFRNNTAPQGGGVQGCVAKNCLISGNTSTQNGAGSYFSLLNNCTVAGNVGIGVCGGTAVNTIISGNVFSDGTDAGEFNVVSNTFCVNCCIPVSRSGSGNVIADPGFVSADGENYHLGAGSPCIDAGLPTQTPADHDLDGNSRLRNGCVDIGAYELQDGIQHETATQTVYVDSASNGGDGRTPEMAFKEIQDALDATVGELSVCVAPGVYGPINTYDRPLRIYSRDGIGSVVIDGSKTGSDGVTNRCATLGFSYGDSYDSLMVGPVETNSVLDGIVLINGCAEEGGGSFRGALRNCIVSNCVATSGGGCYGGFVEDSRIVANHAAFGGGLCEGFADRCLILDNAATQYGGGTYGMVNIRNCVVARNVAFDTGGGCCFTRSPSFNMTIYGNRALLSAGFYGCSSLDCSIIWNNTLVDGETISNFDDEYAFMMSCCTYPLADSSYDCIDDDPLLCDPDHDDFRLLPFSPCIDFTTVSSDGSLYSPGLLDCAGNPRIKDAKIDLGAYEGAVDVPCVGIVKDGLGRVSGGGVAQIGDRVVICAQEQDALHKFEGFFTNGVAVVDGVWKEKGCYCYAYVVTESCFFTARFASAAIYVSADGDDENNGSTEVKAKRTIQGAIDCAGSGDVVVVGPGVYSPVEIESNYLKLRIEAVEGAEKTIIDAKGNGRCAKFPDYGTNVVLKGFTLCNGNIRGYAGGCVGGLLYDCVISNCCATYLGGGVVNSSLYNCKIIGNTGCCEGGGAHYCELYNCIVANNTVARSGYIHAYGGGTYSGKAYNCTIVGNTSDGKGGGSYETDLNNSIIAGNSASSDRNVSSCATKCCYQNNSASAVGFAPSIVGMYNLMSTSPCVDAGDNSLVKTECDINGAARIAGDAVDIGASEYYFKECKVVFELGENAERIGGGELNQTVTNYCSATAPLIQSRFPNLLFLGWSHSFDCVLDDMTIKANYLECAEGTVVAPTAITADMTWDPSKVYVINGMLTVFSGVKLTIPAGTIVKFTTGSSLSLKTGSSCVCKGAIFTHVADDTYGGDTYGDGDRTKPEEGAYSIDSNVDDDETTQYRYQAPIEVGGTLSGLNRWPGHKTYKVKSNIVLASGATLTIEPGAVVKFGSGLSLTINSGATLNATGTRSSPIVLTSIKDDEYGGDTNGDGESSLPYAGDWARITTSGNLNMTYCRIRYCNNNSDRGAIQGQSGKVVFDNGIIEASVYECVRMNGGTFISHNSIFRDASMGFGYYGGSGTYVYNGVVADCTIACRAANKHFYNTVFYRCATFLESTSSSCDHCVFFNPDGFSGAHSATQAGKNGNVWADPKFKDVDSGDYRIEGNSPCIDAGNGQVASAVDYFSQPRQNIQGVEQTGTADANGKYPDIGIYEYQPRFAGSDVDLMVKSVTVPDKLTVGEVVEISWREANIGSVDVEGPWSDKVELIADDGTVASLGTTLVKGGIAAGGERIVSSTFRVPSAIEGSCVIRVTVNYARDIYEGTFTANNVLKSNAAVLELSGLDFSTETTGAIKLSPGKQVAYAVAGLPWTGGSILLHSAAGANFAAYVGFGKVPTSHSAVSSYYVLPNGDVLVSIPKQTDAATAYLMLEAGADVVNASLDATVSDIYPAIYAISKESMPSIGTQSLAIYGVGMSEVVAVELRSDTATLVGTSIRAATDCELSASFDLSAAKAGTYRAVIKTKDNVEAISTAIVTILPSATAKADLEMSLQAPSAIRQNRWYEAIVKVRNVGDADAEAPIVVLTGSGLVFKDPDGGNGEYEGILHVLATSETGNPLVIQPGEETACTISFKSTSGSSATIAYQILDIADAKWESVISQGDLDSAAWEEYGTEYRRGFDSVQHFLREVARQAVLASVDSWRPHNALRLYELVQKQKQGEEFGVVSGYLHDEQNQPVAGATFGITSISSESVSYVTTDDQGSFVAYAVPTGDLAFVANDVTIAPRQKVALGSVGISGLSLEYRATEESEQSGDDALSYNELIPLPIGDGRFVWASASEVRVGNPLSPEGALLVAEGASFRSLQVKQLTDGKCALAFLRNDAGTNSLQFCAIAIVGNEVLVGKVMTLQENVSAFSEIIVSGEDAPSVIYKKFDKSLGAGAWYKIDLEEDDCEVSQSPVLLSAARRPLSAGSGMDYSIPDCPMLSLCGFSFGVWADVKGGNLEQRSCCVWSKYSTSDIRVSVSVPGSAPGSAISGSGSGSAEDSWLSYCSRKFGQSPNDCSEEHRVMASHKGKANYRISCQYEQTFLDTAKIMKGLKGLSYKVVRNIPLSVSLKWGVSATIGVDADINQRNVPGGGSYTETTDTIGLQLAGQISGNIDIGWSEYDGTRGRGRKARKWGFDTGLDLLDEYGEAHGSVSVSGQTTIHQVNGKATCDSMASGSFDVRCASLGITGTLVYDDGAFHWKMDYDFFFIKGQKNINGVRRLLSSVPLDDNVEFLLADEMLSEGVSLNTWDVYSAKVAGHDCACYCGEYVDDNRIRRGVFLLDRQSATSTMLNNKAIDVKHMSVCEFSDGSKAVLYTGCEPDFTGEPEDLLASYANTRLYVQWFKGGSWQDAMLLDTSEEQEADGHFSAVKQEGRLLVVCNSVVWSGDSRNGSSRLKGYVLNSSDGSVEKLGTIFEMGEENSELVYVSPSWKADVPQVCFVTGADDGDVVSVACFDGEWNVTALAADEPQEQQPLLAAQASKTSVNKSTPLSSSGCSHCSKGCICHCVGDDPTPRPGCGCSSKCTKCKGDCGSNCKCGKKHQMSKPQSSDPNEMSGPDGKGNARCVRDGDWMNYTIYFENKAEATAAAQDVFVTLPKDSELDWSTFELGVIAFGENVDKGLVGKSQGTSNYAMPNSLWSVRTEVTHTESAVKWHLRVIDPSTPDNYPEDVYAGFLPPNDSTGRGEGYLRYKVKVREGATAGKIIGASAIIVFDDNPAIETDPAWSNTVSRLVAVSGKAGASTKIMVDPNWIKANIGESATDAQVAEALNKVGKNGIKVWANAALGLDPNDENDQFLVDAPQNDDSSKVTVKSLKGDLPESAWTPIKYRVDVDKDGSGKPTVGTAQDEDEFGIDIGGEDDPTGIYKLLAVFTDDDGVELDEVAATNQIGILRKAATHQREIVPVPWKKFSTGDDDIAVSNLVKTAGLSAGDKLYVYDDDAKRYATWELKSDKTWKPVKTVKVVNGKLEVQTADSPEVATVKRGSGVWLERQDTSKPITLVGQHDAAGAVTAVGGGTTAEPKWNLIASPAITNWNLNAISEGVGAKDRIIVPTGGEPRIYTRDASNTKWGYTAYEANAKGIVKPVRKEDDTTIAPGTGLWYVSEGGTPTIKW